MKKRKSTEEILRLMDEGIDGTNIVLDRDAKVIIREDNSKVVAVLDKTLNVKPQTQVV